MAHTDFISFHSWEVIDVTLEDTVCLSFNIRVMLFFRWCHFFRWSSRFHMQVEVRGGKGEGLVGQGGDGHMGGIGGRGDVEGMSMG